MEMHILIVDDEMLARRRLKNLLAKVEQSITINECGNGKEALDFLQKNSVDLLFLDVQMPELSGFEMLQQLPPDTLPPTIFVTAYDKYALKAFDVHAIDYLLKPFDDERFFEAFNRVPWPVQDPENSDPVQQKLLHLLSELSSNSSSNSRTTSSFPDKLVIKQSGKIHFVNTSDISHIQAEGKYLHVYTQAETYKIRQTLIEIENKLSPQKFLRIHRSRILNTDFIQEMQHWYKGAYVFILRDGERLISGNSYRKNIEWILQQIS